MIKEEPSIISPKYGDLSPYFVQGGMFAALGVYAIVGGMIQVVSLYRRKTLTTSIRSPFAYIKLMLCTMQLFVIIMELIGIHKYPLELKAELINLVGLILMTVIHYLEYFKSKIPNGVVLVYWAFSFLIHCFMLLNHILRHSISSTRGILAVISLMNSIFIFIIEMKIPISSKVTWDERFLESPYDRADIVSKLTFGWMQNLIKRGYYKYLTEEDLPMLPKDLKSATTSKRFEKNWNNQKSERRSIVLALVKSFGGQYFVCCLLKFGQSSVQFIQPQLLRLLIQFVNEYIESRKKGTVIPVTRGFIISFAMFACSLSQTMFSNQYFRVMFNTGMKVKSSLISSIYKKSMVLSIGSKQNSSTGDIVNLMSVDVQRFQDSVQTFQLAWSSPFQIILCLVSLYNLVGHAMWSGVLIMVIMIPINSKVARALKKLKRKQMKVKDERTSLMSEILNNIKSLKLYGWESAYLEKLNEVRDQRELKIQLKVGIFTALTVMLWNFAPTMVSCSTFASFLMFGDGKTLSSDIVFPCLTLFNLLSFPLSSVPQVISSVIETQVALERLTKFLHEEELQAEAIERYPNSVKMGDVAVSIQKASFIWNVSEPNLKVALIDLNMEFKKGELACIVGKVGSGKSAILQAIIGDLFKISGDVEVHGNIAYAAQVPWIMNGSIKDNILFGHTYDPEFYQHVIKACALTVDLKILPKGDQTLVGEKGISLSGGQKARLSLARAVYARADIYLIDDALSAVDEHVGKHLIDHVLGPNGLLKSKCKVLATNNIGVLNTADNIYMVEDGRVVEHSEKYTDLNDDSKLYNLIKDYGKSQDQKPSDDGKVLLEDEDLESEDESDIKSLKKAVLAPLDEVLQRRAEDKEEDEEVLKRKEHTERGSVSWNVYKEYIEACNPYHFIFWVATIILCGAINLVSGVWLKRWSEANADNGYNVDVSYYLGGYLVIGLSSSVLYLAQNASGWIFCSIDASRSLHRRMASRVLRAPMSFFETTPIGRILNRFSNDVFKVDESLIRVFGMFFNSCTKAFFTMLVIIFATWEVIIILLPLSVLYFYYRAYFSKSCRELRRLESISRSPVYANFQESLNGVSTIRAYGQSQRFMFMNQYKVDKNLRAYDPSMNANRWLSVRLEFMATVIIFGAAMFAVLAVMEGRGSAGLTGLSLSYALQSTQNLNGLVRMSVEVETNIVAVERIMEYSSLKTEAPEVIESNRPADNWPSDGRIQFKDYSTRYREGLELVLKNITLSIAKKEKVGIVGRTGAGKSSLTLALFRIIEAVEGHIEIDDVDTSKIGLRDLRKNLSIIPQDSQVFEGTVRSNLDPFSKLTDDELWKALELSHLKTHVLSMYKTQTQDKDEVSKDILSEVKLSEGGSNLSVGQRQLMCLARALLVPSHILVLDEATASVDVETDLLLQSTIRNEFKDRTILIIAHRINTILDSDKILVLDKGEVAEFDTPETLLQDEQSMFYSLCKHSGFIKN